MHLWSGYVAFFVGTIPCRVIVLFVYQFPCAVEGHRLLPLNALRRDTTYLQVNRPFLLRKVAEVCLDNL